MNRNRAWANACIHPTGCPWEQTPVGLAADRYKGCMCEALKGSLLQVQARWACAVEEQARLRHSLLKQLETCNPTVADKGCSLWQWVRAKCYVRTQFACIPVLCDCTSAHFRRLGLSANDHEPNAKWLHRQSTTHYQYALPTSNKRLCLT